MARHGIQEVWIVDVQHRCLLTYASPADGQYGTQATIDRLGVSPLAGLPSVTIDLEMLLGD